MMTRTTAFLVVWMSMSMIAAAPASAQTRDWTEHHQEQRDSAGRPEIRWTTIATVDDVQPFLRRVLYMDRAGRRLVIRDLLNENTKQSQMTIQDVASGEIVGFEIQNQATLVVTAGSRQMKVRRSEVEAYNPQGPTFPPAVRTEAAALFGGLSPEFREALGTLARTGCHDRVEFFGTAVRYAYLFFDDVDCMTVPVGSGELLDPPGLLEAPADESYVHGFDPAVTAPGAFEQTFGRAYYQ